MATRKHPEQNLAGSDDDIVHDPFVVSAQHRKILDRFAKEQRAAKNDVGANIVNEVISLMQASRTHTRRIDTMRRWIERNISVENDEVRQAVAVFVTDYVAKTREMLTTALDDLEAATKVA